MSGKVPDDYWVPDDRWVPGDCWVLDNLLVPDDPLIRDDRQGGVCRAVLGRVPNNPLGT